MQNDSKPPPQGHIREFPLICGSKEAPASLAKAVGGKAKGCTNGGGLSTLYLAFAGLASAAGNSRGEFLPPSPWPSMPTTRPQPQSPRGRKVRPSLTCGSYSCLVWPLKALMKANIWPLKASTLCFWPWKPPKAQFLALKCLKRLFLAFSPAPGLDLKVARLDRRDPGSLF